MFIIYVSANNNFSTAADSDNVQRAATSVAGAKAEWETNDKQQKLTVECWHQQFWMN